MNTTVTRQRIGTRGFTLIEVMAVVALISGVFVVALNFYIDLSSASTRASEYTRDIRRATAILDRIARDFESAILLVKLPEVDPIDHPWLFVGESRVGNLGADHIKFVTRNHDPRRVESPQTNLAVVAYTVERDENDWISLYRWSSPRLPESLDKSFPSGGAEGSFLLADGLHSFGVRFVAELNESGVEEVGSRQEWDSTTLIDSGNLPRAVEIELSIADSALLEDVEPASYKRTVLIPVRPLEMAALTDPGSSINGGSGAGDEDEPGDKDSDKKKNKSPTAYTPKECFRPDATPSEADLMTLLPCMLVDEWNPSCCNGLPAGARAAILPKCCP